ncbi:triose-phosphate isomerase [bacterium]|nr:triose-phosphate isomerase [bacterium]
MQKPIFIGNWKMNKSGAEACQYLERFAPAVTAAKLSDQAEIVLAVPYTLIETMQRELTRHKATIALAAQNVHWLPSGAHTGEISAPMLKEFGVSHVLVGHSERRQFYGESDEGVFKRAEACLGAGLIPIICIGETGDEYKRGISREVVSLQIKNGISKLPKPQVIQAIIAYEPVWAIGTGLSATPEIAALMHSHIRSELNQVFGPTLGEQIRVIYGGSASRDNAQRLCNSPEIDGLLPGGASLDADHFLDLIKAGIKKQ